MRTPVPENIMEKRRLERLKQLTFFMRDERVPPNARTVMSRGACLSLLTGFFQNSHWRAAWWATRKAAEYSWMKFGVTCQLFWHYKVMRRTREEVEEIFER